ncbi:MAG: hypothetical protein KJ880_03910 [Candidatus Omnitrophica bacterium]|nr:hypothetical protein [Candidatus Omnitrophota bacterium]
MQDLNSIKKRITEMAKLALKMWRDANSAFMQHDLAILAGVLQDENKLNDFEKGLTSELVEFSRSSASEQEKATAIIFVDVVADLELIGDYCKDILERVEIKIEEKLMFSEDAVKDYETLYEKTERALEEIAFVLERDNFSLVKEVLRSEEHIDKLVDIYRASHNKRLVAGVCTPIACNMFLNMLDFTAAVYYHAKKIARNLLKIK